MIKGIPRTERIWTEYRTSGQEIFYITSKENNRDTFFLYRIDGGAAVKLGKSKSPAELEKKIYQKGKRRLNQVLINNSE